MKYSTVILAFFLTLHSQVVIGASINFDRYADACLKDPFEQKAEFSFSPKIPINLLPNGCSAIEYLEDIQLTVSSFNSNWKVRGGPKALRTEPTIFFYNPLVSHSDLQFQSDLNKADWFLEELSILSKQIDRFGLDKISPDERWRNVHLFGSAYLGLDELCSTSIEYFKQRFFIKELLFKNEFLRYGLIGIDQRARFISDLIRGKVQSHKNKNYCDAAVRSIEINIDALIAQFNASVKSKKYMEFYCGPLKHLIFNRHKGSFLVKSNALGPPSIYRPVYEVRRDIFVVLTDERCVDWADQNIAFIETQLQDNLSGDINLNALEFEEILK